MARKIAELRILDGEVSVEEAGAPVLLVSQFTLYGRTAKGRRPSWSDAAPGSVAEPLIEDIAKQLRERGIQVEQGRFGAMMKVASVNEGPFTVLVET
ncbi:D-aminoacyl-tRNA deacylase [Corynebacterium camporealensis]|nr:D-aminoacyl-tRNA deacylase [Corynebacterium camporealensis]